MRSASRVAPGLGLASAQLTGTVLRDVPVEVSGQGSATQSTVRQIGSALGTAFAGGTLSVALALTLGLIVFLVVKMRKYVDKTAQSKSSQASPKQGGSSMPSSAFNFDEEDKNAK